MWLVKVATHFLMYDGLGGELVSTIPWKSCETRVPSRRGRTPKHPYQLLEDKRSSSRWLAYLEEAVYDGIGGRDGTNPAVRVPMGPELRYQVLLPDPQDFREVTKFIVCGLCLWQTLIQGILKVRGMWLTWP
jgi:hypothetical protein